MEQILNLEIQKLVEGLEELPYEDDNFSSDMDEEDAETVMSLNKENTNWKIDDVVGINEWF